MFGWGRKKTTVRVPPPMQAQAELTLAWERDLLSLGAVPADPKPTRKRKPKKAVAKRPAIRAQAKPLLTVIAGGRATVAATKLESAVAEFAERLIWGKGHRVPPIELLRRLEGEGRQPSRHAAEALKRVLMGRGARYVRIQGKRYISACCLATAPDTLAVG